MAYFSVDGHFCLRLTENNSFSIDAQMEYQKNEQRKESQVA